MTPRRSAWALLAAALGAGAAEPPWFEGTIQNWNAPGAEVPGAPPAASPDPRCAAQERPAVTRDDRAVTAAGWRLVGASQVFGRTRAFLGASGYDAMCRPLDYQGFVFVESRLAGTLSPRLMRSRSDGALTVLRVVSESAVEADFARYLDQDPLCCPSRLVSVAYSVESRADGALLVPGSARVEPGR
jgi:hypothetical protein